MAEQMAEPRTVVDDAHELISSRRVEGTPVYNRKDERLGAIHSVMIEKKSGKVAYAVLSFGGFLGMKEHVHPVPWEMLTYDVDMDAYLVDLTRDQLKNAPTLGLDEADRPRDRQYDEEVSGYYGTMPWWGL
ncbi:PRC-barrel domain-containing protein [Allosphingosinicella sp.]|uniref:PRC-barrel domain-containing protein n=1 Tax=Allosphingosinicella sp. TaxID=2823234 RepID=UPI002FC11868